MEYNGHIELPNYLNVGRTITWFSLSDGSKDFTLQISFDPVRSKYGLSASDLESAAKTFMELAQFLSEKE